MSFYKKALLFLIGALIHTPIFTQNNGPLFSFGALADAQYCNCEAKGSRFYRNSLFKLDSCLAFFDKENLAFIVHLGDIIDKDYDSYNDILPYFDAAKVPLKFVLGNHEFSVADSLKELVPGRLGLVKRYDDFAVGNWRFVMVDGNDESLYAWPKGSKRYKRASKAFDLVKQNGKPQAMEWNGGMGNRQFRWLKRVLKKASNKHEQIILFSHFPIYPPEVHNLWNDGKIVDLLEATPGVVSWMSGHNHQGGYELNNGIHYLILRGMVETASTNAYAVIDVYPERLEVRGIGREPTRTLHFK